MGQAYTHNRGCARTPCVFRVASVAPRKSCQKIHIVIRPEISHMWDASHSILLYSKTTTATRKLQQECKKVRRAQPAHGHVSPPNASTSMRNTRGMRWNTHTLVLFTGWAPGPGWRADQRPARRGGRGERGARPTRRHTRTGPASSLARTQTTARVKNKDVRKISNTHTELHAHASHTQEPSTARTSQAKVDTNTLLRMLKKHESL